jgi:hypothetical protein
MATYTTYSPWYKTNENSLYLELLEIRPIPAEDDDITYSIEPQYRYRPDLLAYDLYGSPKLWWVFAQRNMGIIKDPVFDFEPGKQIKIPKQSNLKRFLGI